MKSRKRRFAGPVPADPDRNCPICRGVGWVESAQPPEIPAGADPKKYDRPVVRCACTSTKPENRPEPKPLFDPSQRRAGERE